MKLILKMIMLLTLLVSCATQQERAERRAQIQKAVNEAMESRQWRIDITSMRPFRYGSRMVSSDFYLELRNDTLRSYLPYLGQVYWKPPTLMPSIGLNFEEPVLRYQQDSQKAHGHQMGIYVKTEEDTYLYAIDFNDSGEATIRVRSNNRDPIGFDGNIRCK